MEKKASLTEKAYKKIRNKIICFELKPGTRINDQSLSESLEIGRTPVREALVRLASERLLKNEPRNGFFVSEIGFAEVKSILETARILYRAVSVLAPIRIQPGEIQYIEEINNKLNIAMEQKDYLNVVIYNSQFHKAINESIANTFLSSIIDNIDSQYARLCYLNFSGLSATDEKDLENHYKKTRIDHEKMIEALKKRDQKLMIELIDSHLMLFSEQLAKYINPSGASIDLASISHNYDRL